MYIHIYIYIYIYTHTHMYTVCAPRPAVGKRGWSSAPRPPPRPPGGRMAARLGRRSGGPKKIPNPGQLPRRALPPILAGAPLLQTATAAAAASGPHQLLKPIPRRRQPTYMYISVSNNVYTINYSVIMCISIHLSLYTYVHVTCLTQPRWMRTCTPWKGISHRTPKGAKLGAATALPEHPRKAI